MNRQHVPTTLPPPFPLPPTLSLPLPHLPPLPPPKYNLIYSHSKILYLHCPKSCLILVKKIFENHFCPF